MLVAWLDGKGLFLSRRWQFYFFFSAAHDFQNLIIRRPAGARSGRERRSKSLHPGFFWAGKQVYFYPMRGLAFVFYRHGGGPCLC